MSFTIFLVEHSVPFIGPVRGDYFYNTKTNCLAIGGFIKIKFEKESVDLELISVLLSNI